MGGNQNALMQELLNFEASLPLALVVVSLVIAKTLRPIVYSIATLILTRKANPEIRIRTLRVLCSDRGIELNLGRKRTDSRGALPSDARHGDSEA